MYDSIKGGETASRKIRDCRLFTCLPSRRRRDRGCGTWCEISLARWSAALQARPVTLLRTWTSSPCPARLSDLAGGQRAKGSDWGTTFYRWTILSNFSPWCHMYCTSYSPHSHFSATHKYSWAFLDTHLVWSIWWIYQSWEWRATSCRRPSQ